jgi:hypothetical protein
MINEQLAPVDDAITLPVGLGATSLALLSSLRTLFKLSTTSQVSPAPAARYYSSDELYLLQANLMYLESTYQSGPAGLTIIEQSWCVAALLLLQVYSRDFHRQDTIIRNNVRKLQKLATETMPSQNHRSHLYGTDHLRFWILYVEGVTSLDAADMMTFIDELRTLRLELQYKNWADARGALQSIAWPHEQAYADGYRLWQRITDGGEAE